MKFLKYNNLLKIIFKKKTTTKMEIKDKTIKTYIINAYFIFSTLLCIYFYFIKKEYL